MLRVLSIFLSGLLVLGLAACDTTSSGSQQLASDGKPPPSVYRIRAGETSKVQFRMLDSINALRSASGLNPVQLDSNLTAAAATHSRDMANQNRPWHFGSDGSSPLDRVQRAGYAGSLIGENISETYETELETLAAWMEMPGTRAVIMDPAAYHMGFAWHQEKGGKLWWTLIMGG